MTDQPEVADTEVEQTVIDQGDAPIGSLGEDRLGRRPFAEALAAEILDAPADRGYVMGLTGPWGSGKTSILNMTVDALENKAIVVQFNPWMFSGTEVLISSFFEEIGKQLDKRDSKLKGIAEKLATYGHLLSPLAALVGAGTAASGASDVLEKLAARPSVFEQRKELRTLLEGLDRRLVVIVDDVDRLRPQEVLDIVRLVRLVGDFPNTLYLLAFDRARVEECLDEGKAGRGRAYLEKIVQVTHDVPAARQPDVTAIFLAGLQHLRDTVPSGPLDVGDWQNIFAFVVRPLLATPRSVRRLLGSLSMTMRLVGDEVALADLIGIEAIRVLRPAMFEAIIAVADYLSVQTVVPGQGGYQTGRSPADAPIGPMVAVDAALAQDVCRWLFPGARHYFDNMHYGSEWEGTWRRQRKIASASVFRFYLERQLPDGVVSARVVDAALEHLTSREDLQSLVDALSPTALLDLIERMSQTLDEIPVNEAALDKDPARVGLPILMDLLPRLPEDTGMPSFGGSMVLMRAALGLLKRLPNPEVRGEVVRAVLPEIRSLSARLILLLVVGHRRGIGNGLLAADVATELENTLTSDLIALPADDFAKEPRTVCLADLLAETPEGRTALDDLAQDNRVMLSLFSGSVGQIRGQTIGAAAVELTKTLSWDRLASYFGKETLIRRTAELLAAVTDDAMTISNEESEALGLAADYATGNRPETSFERMMWIQQGAGPSPDVVGAAADPEAPDDEPEREPHEAD